MGWDDHMFSAWWDPNCGNWSLWCCMYLLKAGLYKCYPYYFFIFTPPSSIFNRIVFSLVCELNIEAPMPVGYKEVDD